MNPLQAIINATNAIINALPWNNKTGQITGPVMQGMLIALVAAIVGWVVLYFAPLASPTFTGTVTLPQVTIQSIGVQLTSLYGGTLSVSQSANQIYQRTTRTGSVYGFGSGPVSASVTLFANVNKLEYQVVLASDGVTVVQAWASIGTGGVLAGTTKVSGLAPASTNAYFFQIRANGDNSVIATSAAFYVGEMSVYAGQSLSVTMVSTAVTGDTTTFAGAGTSVSTPTYGFGAYRANLTGPDTNLPPTSWQVPVDAGVYNGAFEAEFCRLVIANANVACGFTGYAVGSSDIASWQNGQPFNATLKSILDVSAPGGFGTLMWYQGHADAKEGTTQTQYVLELTNFVNNLQARYSGVSFVKLIGTIPGIGNYAGSTPASIETIRAGGKQYSYSAVSAEYIDALDTQLEGDLVHPTQIGDVSEARHWFRGAMHLWGLRSDSDAGPFFTTAVLTGATVKLTMVQQPGGSALVPQPTLAQSANQFQVFNTGTTSGPLTISSITIPSSTEIDLNLSGTPAGAVDTWCRLPPDTSTIIATGIYDNVTDGDGLTQGRQILCPTGPIPPPLPTISNLVLNIDMSAPNVAYIDTAFTTPALIGQAVGGIKDKSGGNNNFIQATPALQQIYTANVANGLPGLRYTGLASQLMNLVGTSTLPATLKASTGIESLIVFKPVTLFGAASETLTCGQSASVTSFDKMKFAEAYAAGPYIRSARTGTATNATTVVSAAGTYAPNLLVKAVWRFNGSGAAQFGFVNAGPETSNTPTFTDTTSTWNFCSLGASIDGGVADFFLDGYLLELDVWNTTGSSGDEAALVSYATAKWGN